MDIYIERHSGNKVTNELHLKGIENAKETAKNYSIVDDKVFVYTPKSILIAAYEKGKEVKYSYECVTGY